MDTRSRMWGGCDARDDSIKQFSIQIHTVHIFNMDICRVGLYTELFHAIIHTLFPCFLLTCFPTSYYKREFSNTNFEIGKPC